MGLKLKHPLHIRGWTGCIRRQEAWLHPDCTASPEATAHVPLDPWFFQGEKSPEDNQSPSIVCHSVGAPTLTLHRGDHRGVWGPNHWESYWDEGGRNSQQVSWQMEFTPARPK